MPDQIFAQDCRASGCPKPKSAIRFDLRRTTPDSILTCSSCGAQYQVDEQQYQHWIADRVQETFDHQDQDMNNQLPPAPAVQPQQPQPQFAPPQAPQAPYAAAPPQIAATQQPPQATQVPQTVQHPAVGAVAPGPYATPPPAQVIPAYQQPPQPQAPQVMAAPALPPPPVAVQAQAPAQAPQGPPPFAVPAQAQAPVQAPPVAVAPPPQPVSFPEVETQPAQIDAVAQPPFSATDGTGLEDAPSLAAAPDPATPVVAAPAALASPDLGTLDGKDLTEKLVLELYIRARALAEHVGFIDPNDSDTDSGAGYVVSQNPFEEKGTFKDQHKIFNLLIDQQWHTLDEISNALSRQQKKPETVAKKIDSLGCLVGVTVEHLEDRYRLAFG